MATTLTPIWSRPGYDDLGHNKSSIALSQTTDLARYYSYNMGNLAPYTKATIIAINKFEKDGETGDDTYLIVNDTAADLLKVICIRTHYNQTVDASKREVLWTTTVTSGTVAYGMAPVATIAQIDDGVEILPYILVSQISGAAPSINDVYKIHPLTGVVSVFYSGVVTGSNIYASPIYQHGGYIYLWKQPYGQGWLLKISQSGALVWTSDGTGGIGDLNGSKLYFHDNKIWILFGASSSDSGNYFVWLYNINDSTGTIEDMEFVANLSTAQPASTHLAFNPNKGIDGILYVTATAGGGLFTSSIYAYDTALDLKSSLSINGIKGPFCMDSNGLIYLTAGNTLYIIEDTGSGTLTIKGSTSVLPTISSAGVILDADENIIIGTTSSTVNNLFVYKYQDPVLNLITSLKLPFSGDISVAPSIGYGGMLYLGTTTNNILYAYGTSTSPTTTTTTTTLAPTTTTTTSTGTGTTTTTTTPTTTTTTTTPAPLSIVETTQFELVNTQIIPIQTSNASDDSSTKNSLISQALTFGTIAPNEISKTIIIQLNIPHVNAITNIKLGLITTGGITFANNIFGITNSIELRSDIVPESYFLGVNTDNLSTNAYNISIPNKDNHTSQYVYLNIHLPQNQVIGTGLIKFHWFFDYA